MVVLDAKNFLSLDPRIYHPDDGINCYKAEICSGKRIWFVYQLGIFPWFNPEDEILVVPQSLDLCFFFPNELKISKSMKK